MIKQAVEGGIAIRYSSLFLSTLLRSTTLSTTLYNILPVKREIRDSRETIIGRVH